MREMVVTMPKRRNWSPEETRAAFALYFTLPSGKWSKSTPEIVRLAQTIGRSPDAVVFKLGNLRARDPQRPSKGLQNASMLDQKIWEDYAQDPESITRQAVRELESLTGSVAETPIPEYSEIDLPLGAEREVVTTARVNQTYFREMLIENYDARCCLTQLREPCLLVASHIKPWKASTAEEKVAADNGILINALHDRAFDQGLMTLDDSGSRLRFVVSRKVRRDDASEKWLWRFNGTEMLIPRRLAPRHEFIEYHNDVIFKC